MKILEKTNLPFLYKCDQLQVKKQVFEASLDLSIVFLLEHSTAL